MLQNAFKILVTKKLPQNASKLETLKCRYNPSRCFWIMAGERVSEMIQKWSQKNEVLAVETLKMVTQNEFLAAETLKMVTKKWITFKYMTNVF